MRSLNLSALAGELSAAYAARRTDVVPPSSRDAAFDLEAAYAVEAELVRRRRENGHATVGRKVGFANKAVWRALKLETLAWASMYDDTVQYADHNVAALDISRMCAPKIEPEIVFKMGGRVRRAGQAGSPEAAVVLEDIEWLALGFEIIDSVYVDWKFQPADFVAASGLHAALIVGEPLLVTDDRIASLVDQLSTFTVVLGKDGAVVAEGSGRNVLRNPALCVGELASAIARRAGAESLGAGELVSSGTLTEAQRIAPGETWTAAVEGIALPALTLKIVA